MRQRCFYGLSKHTEGTFCFYPKCSLSFNGDALKNEVVRLMMKMKRGAAGFWSVGEPA